MYIHEHCIYRPNQQSGDCWYFLNGSFYELANPLCLWMSGTEVVWFMGIFSVFIGQKWCVHTFMYCRFTSAGMCHIQVYELWCRVLKNCKTLCSMIFWPCLWSILKQKQNCLQGSDTSLEFNTWPLPKYLGLLKFRTVSFLHFQYVQRIENYTVLTKAVPRINLVKMPHSQVNIFIIFITFYLENSNVDVAIVMKMWNTHGATSNKVGGA